MRERFNSIWTYYLVPNQLVCITTNGTLTKDGKAVMGRGNAAQAAITVTGIERQLGEHIAMQGNVPAYLGKGLRRLVIIPVKHNWWEKADLNLIRKSLAWLKLEAEAHPFMFYHLPRPGCGNGGRDWTTEVLPMVYLLPDNVIVHHVPGMEGEHRDHPSGTKQVRNGITERNRPF